ncbi:MAG: transposase [Gammaproteobacteria bacterium]
MVDSRCRFHGRDLRKGRVSIGGQVYLLTTVTLYRRPVFADLALGRCVVRALKRVSNAGAAESLAFVVMPDHVHWLIALCEQARLESVMRSFKAGSAKLVNERLGRKGVPLWQRGYHDHALRREEDLQRVARYLVANPLRAGLVERIGDYPLWDAIWL